MSQCGLTGGNTALNSDLCQALGSGSAPTHAPTPRVLIILDICVGVVVFPHRLFYWGLVKPDRCQHSLAARAVHTFTAEFSSTSSDCSPGTPTSYAPRLLPQFLSAPAGQPWFIISSYFNSYSWQVLDAPVTSSLSQSLLRLVLLNCSFQHCSVNACYTKLFNFWPRQDLNALVTSLKIE